MAVMIAVPAGHALPAGQGPAQDGAESPIARPKNPAAHSEQLSAPRAENVPGAHKSGVAGIGAVAYAKSPFFTSGVNTEGAAGEMASMNVLFGVPAHPGEAGDDAGNKLTVTDVEFAAATWR